jgi:hypothetical protein
MVSVSGAGLAPGPAGCASAGVTASPNIADQGWNSHYWNTLHFIRPVLPSLERRRNGPRHRRRGRATPWNSASSTPHACCPGTVELHGDSAEHDRIMDEVAFIVAADKAGFKYTWASEHHFLTDYSHLSASESFLAFCGRQDQQHPHRLGHLQHHPAGQPPGPHRRAGGHAGPPLRGPLRVRHRPRLFDHRAEGLRDQDSELTREMVAEALPQIVRMWKDEDYSYDGKFFSMPSRNVLPKPYSSPTRPSGWRPGALRRSTWPPSSV